MYTVVAGCVAADGNGNGGPLVVGGMQAGIEAITRVNTSGGGAHLKKPLQRVDCLAVSAEQCVPSSALIAPIWGFIGGTGQRWALAFHNPCSSRQPT